MYIEPLLEVVATRRTSSCPSPLVSGIALRDSIFGSLTLKRFQKTQRLEQQSKKESKVLEAVSCLTPKSPIPFP
jgi:hypothetical protein